MSFNLKSILQSLPAIIISTLVVAGFAFAWTEPAQNPPLGNTAPPLNTSSTGQSKAGGLIINTGGAATGLIIDKGNVGIGTQTPEQKLDVVGNIKATGLCIGADCRTSWPSGSGTISATEVVINNGTQTISTSYSFCAISQIIGDADCRVYKTGDTWYTYGANINKSDRKCSAMCF